MSQRIICLVALSGLSVWLAPRFGSAEDIWPERSWVTAAPSDVGMNESQLAKARAYALTGEGSGHITRHGKLVMSWGDPEKTYDLKSTSKSIGITALGLAIAVFIPIT